MYFTYIAYNPHKDKFSIGVTINLQRRKKILCHNNEGCRMVYIDEFESSEKAIGRENELMNLSNGLLRKLIDQTNPLWLDLLHTRNSNLK